MLFVVFVAVMLIGIVWFKLSDYDSILAMLICAVGGICVIVSLAIIISEYVTVDSFVESNKIRYESLMYQAENAMYDNDNEVGLKALVDQIQDWNVDLAMYKSWERDFWLGIYIPNVFDQFEYIDMSVLSNR